MSIAGQGVDEAALVRRLHAKFFQGFAIKVGFVLLLASFGKDSLLLDAGRWFLTYAFVSVGFGLLLRQTPGDTRLNYWDEALIFVLFTFVARFADSVVSAPIGGVPV